MNNTNELILKKLKERLKKGNKKFGQQMPLDSHLRDNKQEALEELLDLALYLTAALLSIIHKSKESK